MKFLILLEIDNNGTVDLINNWIVGWRTRHVETGQLLLCEMKWQGGVQMIYISGYHNEVYFFTKNLPGPLFEKQILKFNDEE